MSVAFDANLLLYASDPASPLRERAARAIEDHVNGNEIIYAFWPVMTAYLRIATHPAVFTTPLSMDAAVAGVSALIERPNVRSPGEGEDFLNALRTAVAETPVRGNLVTDAHIVALMRTYGVRKILTRDRDFRKFEGIKTIDPFATAR